MRHARSIANENEIFGGITDYPLSEKGKKQAENLVDKFVGLDIHAIYSSPLLRTVETIKPTANKLSKEIIIDYRLIEINVGEWEGIPEIELGENLTKMKAMGYFYGITGQETHEQVAERMYKSLTEIAKNNKGKQVIISSHIQSIRSFLCKVMSIPFEKTMEIIGDIPNVSITTIEYNFSSKSFEIKSIGRI